MFPQSQILLFFVLPIPAWVFIPGIFAVSVASGSCPAYLTQLVRNVFFHQFSTVPYRFYWPCWWDPRGLGCGISTQARGPWSPAKIVPLVKEIAGVFVLEDTPLFVLGAPMHECTCIAMSVASCIYSTGEAARASIMQASKMTAGVLISFVNALVSSLVRPNYMALS
jgi:hypothetical protein